jgi:hypothetical protein
MSTISTHLCGDGRLSRHSGAAWATPLNTGPTSISAAKRLRNLTRDPRVSILIDAYDEDWPQVWRVRLRGTGRAVSGRPGA